MKKATQILGLPLLGIKEGSQKGFVQDIMVDPATKKVQYLILKDAKGYSFNALKVVDVLGAGENYITTQTIKNVTKIYESKEVGEIIEGGFFMLDTTALSNDGNIIGKVIDFTFDERKGDISTIYLDDATEIAIDKITTLSNDIVFVNATGESYEDFSVAKEAPAFVPEAVVEDVPIVEEVAEEVVEEEEEIDDFQREQREFLMGRSVINDVTLDDGTLFVTKGTVITEAIIKEAEKLNAVLELTLNVK